MATLKSLWGSLSRWQLWLVIRWQGSWRVPLAHRFWLLWHEQKFDRWIRRHYGGRAWRTTRLRGAGVQPFLDLLNRPSGGDAYCGGVVFDDPSLQPALHHFRGLEAIDRPLQALLTSQTPSPPRNHVGRLFWCGPLAFHFGHQIADFGSRALLASLDSRSGDLLWLPWRSASRWQDLLPWQRSLLWYLNPGEKVHRFITEPITVRDLVVVPQQARMRAAPSAAHLDALSWCERRLRQKSAGVVYLSRNRFSPCTSPNTMLGAYAAEQLFERFLGERGVNVIYPETIPLEEQLAIYLGADALIVAEGSAQHGLELLGYHPNKQVLVICRRAQQPGMELPLLARFPQAKFVEALDQHWQAVDGVSWNGLALLDWKRVVKIINPLLDQPFGRAEVSDLRRAGEDQLKAIAAQIPLQCV